MKTFYLVLLNFFFVSSVLAMDVSISYAVFKTADEQYVEIHFHYVSNTLNYAEITPESFQAKVETTLLIKQGEKLIHTDKYELSGPIGEKDKDFQNVRRYSLTPGTFELSIKIVDLKEISNIYDFSKNLIVNEIRDKVGASDIQLFASVKNSDTESEMSKNGFAFEILPFNYLDSKFDKINWYSEIYRNGSKDDHYIEFSINSEWYGDAGKQMSKGIKRIPQEDIFPFLKSMSIKDFQSGNYHVLVEVKNRLKEVVSSSFKNFRISNPTLDLNVLESTDNLFDISFTHTFPSEKLDYYLRAHIPIISSISLAALNEVIRNGTDRNKRYFIHRHWVNQSEEHASALFEKYIEVADAVDKMYNSGFGYGFETDRGYIYLKYGRPTQSITVADEISAPPYEIWAFDRVPETGQNNVKFIFYNPSLSHNDFRLLHSTCRGELSNPAWEVDLYRDAVTEDNGSSIDATSASDNAFRNAKRLFNDL